MSFKKKIFSFMTALVVVFGSAPFSFVKSAYADDANLPAPATSKQLIDNKDGTYTIALSVTGETDTSSLTSVSKANVILVLDTSSSMNQNAGNTYYLVTSGTPGNPANEGNSRTTYYRKDGNNYHELYYNNGTWYATRTQRPGGNYNYSDPYSGDFYARSRLWAEKHALIDDNGIIDSLLAQNVPGDANKNDIIEVALVSFGQKGTAQQGFTTNASVLKDKISGIATDSGTNWEEALIRADELADGIRATQSDEDIYVLFLTDGQPSTANNDYTVSNGANGNTGWIARWGAASDNARDLVEDGDTFYGLFTWGESTYEGYLKALVQYAYTGVGAYNTSLSSDYSDYYTNASSTEALISALHQIVNDITTNVGYTNVGLTDGITEMTASSVKASANGEVSGLKYYRSGGSYSTTANGGLGEEWAEAPEATINSKGEVDWSLGNLVLEKGVTYTVAFSVWPKQDSVDLVADLNNGKRSYSSLTDKEKGQIIGSEGSYSLKTNTDYPTVTYSTITTTTVNGQTTTVVSDPVTSTIEQPPLVHLPTDKISLEKKWEDSLDPSQREEICDGTTVCEVVMDFYKDGVKYNTEPIHITEATDWVLEDYLSIAPGLMVAEGQSSYDDVNYQVVTFNGTKYAILREGHEYYFDEHDLNSHYELTNYRYHPMEINDGGGLRVMNVRFVKDASGKITAIEEIKAMESVSATNTIKGGINIQKKVVDESGAEIDSAEEFTIVAHLLDKDGNDYSYDYRIYYGENNPEYESHIIYNDDGSVRYSRSDHQYGSGTITETIYVGDTIRVVNVDAGTRYYVEEPESDIPTGYELVDVDTKISIGSATNFTSTGVDDHTETIDGETYYVMQGNTAWQSEVINKFTYGELKVSKTVEVQSGNKDKSNDEFEFDIKVYSDDTKTTELEDYSTTITLKDGESETISQIPAGAYYEVTETEVSGYTTSSTGDTGTIVKNTTSKADFKNVYKVEPKSTQAKVSKAFGDYWDLTKINGFEFVLTPVRTSTGSYPAITARNTTATSVLPASWTFNITDEGTWVYEVSETEYNHPGVSPLTDNEIVTLTITSVDNDDGTLNVTKTYSKNSASVTEENATIDNTYKTLNTVSETIKVKKTIVDNVTGDHDASFKFELKDSADKVIDTATVSTNNLSGQGSFKALTFDTAGTYTYTVSEKDEREGEDGWTYDETIYTVTIDVSEDYTTALLSSTMTINGKEADTAEFSNEYTVEPTTATVTVTKMFDNFWYEGDSFNFTITENGGTFTQTKSVNEANPTATFTLSFDAPGDYKYTVTESTQFTRPGISQVTSNPITVKVSVEDNDDGTLTATVTQGAAITIENTYETKPTSTKLNVTKTIEDKSNSKKDGTFTFDLKKADGSVEDTITISTRNLSGEESFKDIEFTKEGIYEYTIVERNGNEAGFTYDTAARNVVIVVKDNKDKAELYVDSVKIDGKSTNTAEIKNTYEAKKTSINLTATKRLEGRDWLDSDEFIFTLTGAGITAQTKTATKNNKTVTFDSIEYTKVGTYEYTISEEKDGMPAGVENVTGNITVTVDVEDDGGELVATAEYSVKDKTIVNEYTTAPTNATLYVLKTIDDQSNSKKDGEFTFDLKNDKGTVIDTVVITTSNLTGTGSFAMLDFDTAGTYKYKIVEREGNEPGFSYDTTARNVVIVVKDNTDEAKLYVDSITIDDEETETAEIENTYKAAETSIKLSATKKLEGRDWLDSDEFTFELTGDDIKTQTGTATKSSKTVEFSSIKYTEVGKHTYTISEVGDLPAGMENITGDITVTVDVRDDDGKLVATAEYSEADQTIVNEYTTKPTDTTLKVKKTITDSSNSNKDGKFTFDLKDEGGNIVGTIEITTRGLTGEGSFEKITFDEAGTYKYTVVERDGDELGFSYDTVAKNAVIIVKDDPEEGKLYVDSVKIDGKSTNTAEIKNTYEAKKTSINLTATKRLEGRDWLDSDEFIFTLTGAGITAQTKTATKNNKTVTFDSIEYTKVGTYTYVIAEDKNSMPAGMENITGDIDVTVTVEDKGGKLVATAKYSVEDKTIVNEYTTAPTNATLYVIKTIDDQSNSKKDGEFTFDLKDSKGTVVDTITINTKGLSGEGSFAMLDFDTAGTYKYKIVEREGNEPGFSYDTTARNVVIVVKDNTDEAKLYVDSIKIDNVETEVAEIENTYKATETSIKLSATKAVEGREWLDSDEFTFELTGDDIKTQTGTATKSSKTVEFSSIKYTEVGKYIYTISEVGDLPAGMENITGDITVTVDVRDDDGKLVATAEYSEADQTIVNEYTTAETSVRFNIKKTIEDLSNSKKDAAFTFMFNEAEYSVETSGLEGELEDMIELNFAEEQTLEFEVYEVDDGQAGFEYDGSVYTVKIEVRDDYDNAQLKATISVDGKKVNSDEYAFKFNNKYQATPTEAQIEVQKIIDVIAGEIDSDEDFEFELRDGNGKLIDTLKITGEGEASFAPIELSKVGTYTYEVSEVAGEAEYYEYDPAVYEVIITVIDEGGELTIESMVTKVAGDEEAENSLEVLVFVNTYDEPEEPKVPDTGRGLGGVYKAGVIETAQSTVAFMLILLGVLFGLIKNKTWRHLIRSK